MELFKRALQDNVDGEQPSFATSGGYSVGYSRSTRLTDPPRVAGHRWLEGTLGNPACLGYFLDFCSIFWIVGQILRFLIEKTCFSSFSSKSHAESFRNFVKKQILNSKHAKFDQKSEIGHVRTCQWAHKGPIWAQIVPEVDRG